MKKLHVTGLFILISVFSNAQNKLGIVRPQFPSLKSCADSEARKEKGKFLTFGFDMGVNRSDLQFGQTQTAGDQITNGFGYRLGIVSNLQFTQRFSFAPKAELSFNATRLDQSNTSYNVNGVNLEFIGHFKYNILKTPFTPYVIAGPNFRLPLEAKEEDYVPTKEDLALDVGIGFEIPLKQFSLAPELRYTFGLSNISSSDNFSDLNYNNIAMVLIFRGK